MTLLKLFFGAAFRHGLAPAIGVNTVLWTAGKRRSRGAEHGGSVAGIHSDHGAQMTGPAPGGGLNRLPGRNQVRDSGPY
jgi:hypothetical protein